MTDRQEILEKAIAAINGDRATDYGDAKDNFKRIADMWTTLLGGQWDFSTTDVAMFMVAVKLCRLYENPDHLDSWVDIAGYAALGGEVSNA